MANQTNKIAPVINGLDREKFFQTLDQLKARPVNAKFKFRLTNQWLDCGHNRSTVRTFSGAGGDHEHAVTFQMDADEPPLLLGQDKGANPVEHLLNALAACVTTSLVYHAAAKGIALEEVESSLEGDIDLQGFLGLDKNVRPGYQEIRMKFKIKSDASDEVLQELVAFAPHLSPVFDSVTKGVSVKVTAERKAEAPGQTKVA